MDPSCLTDWVKQKAENGELETLMDAVRKRGHQLYCCGVSKPVSFYVHNARHTSKKERFNLYIVFFSTRFLYYAVICLARPHLRRTAPMRLIPTVADNRVKVKVKYNEHTVGYLACVNMVWNK